MMKMQSLRVLLLQDRGFSVLSHPQVLSLLHPTLNPALKDLLFQDLQQLKTQLQLKTLLLSQAPIPLKAR